jgi:hypothetical protein
MGEFTMEFLHTLVKALKRNDIDYIVVGGQAIAEQVDSYTQDLDVSNCWLALLQGQVILDGTVAYIPTNQTIIDYNLLVPSGPYYLVVIVLPNELTFPAQTAGTFSAAVVLDDLGQPATS